MAKGDDSRARNAIDYRGDQARNTLNNTLNDVVSPQAHGMWERFNRSADAAEKDYGGLQQNFQSLYNAPLETPGYTPEGLAAIRSRSVAPTRGIYQRSLDELDRHKNLAGGYMPNYAAGRAKMARESSQAISDINTNVNASIAELEHGDLESRRNRQLQSKLSGASGGASLYGTTPGSASMFANQAAGARGDLLNWNQLKNQLELGTMNATTQAGQLPGRFESFTGAAMPWISLGTNMLGGGLGSFGGGGSAGQVKPGANFNWGGWDYNRG